MIPRIPPTALLLFSLFLSHSALAAETSIPSVKAQTVQLQSYARPIRTSGILAYKAQQTLSFKTSGLIQQLNVNVGDKVKVGEILGKLTLDEINAQVEEASARVSLAAKNLKRYQTLHSSNALSKDKLQTAETELAVAQSQLKAARFNQTYSTIKAPVDGLILKREAEEHELITPNEPVFELADESHGWVIKAGVTDENIIRIRKGDKASIQFDALPEQFFNGSISQVGTLADPQTGTFEIEITIPSTSSPLLRAGFVSQITITPSVSDKLALIPAMSIISGTPRKKENASVFLYNPAKQTVYRQTIFTRFIEKGEVAVSTGLSDGDLIITTGAGILRDGDRVNIKVVTQ